MLRFPQRKKTRSNKQQLQPRIATAETKSKTVDAIFKTIDPNHKGVISRGNSEKCATNTQVQTLLGSNEKLKHLTHSKEIYDKFKEMDDNNDKEVTIEEMLSYAQ